MRDDVRIQIREHWTIYGGQINAMMYMAPEASALHYDRALIECSEFYPANMTLFNLAERLSRVARRLALTEVHGDTWMDHLTEDDAARLEMFSPINQRIMMAVGRASAYKSALEIVRERRRSAPLTT